MLIELYVQSGMTGNAEGLPDVLGSLLICACCRDAMRQHVFVLASSNSCR